MADGRGVKEGGEIGILGAGLVDPTGEDMVLGERVVVRLVQEAEGDVLAEFAVVLVVTVAALPSLLV